MMKWKMQFYLWDTELDKCQVKHARIQMQRMVITDLWMQHYFGPHNEVKLASAFNKWQITNKNNEFNVSKYLLYALQYIGLRSICDIL